jgi:hypothetical protein
LIIVLTVCRRDYLCNKCDDPRKLVILKEKKNGERQGYVVPRNGKNDTDDGEYGGKEKEVVGKDGSKVESLIAGSWRHD